MANPPPPYDNITGISRAAMKDNAQITLADYNGNARPGELVVDQTNDNLYVGNISGSLTLIASGSGTETWATLGDKNNASGPSKIALGTNAGITSQGSVAVAIGSNAGNTSQGDNTVAIGTNAGRTSQGTSATAVGSGAGSTTQGLLAVAIGGAAGETGQGEYSVAVGSLAGRTSQANNSIIINATNANLNQTTANTFTVKPVRAVTSVTFAAPTAGSIPAGFSPMYYNPTTGEIIVITT
jgi:hypothetical protein